MKDILIRLLIILLAVFFCLGAGSCDFNCKNPADPSDSTPIENPSFIKAISPDYCILSPVRNYEAMIDSISGKANSMRLFAYCGWASNPYIPWDGSMANLKPEHFEKVNNLIAYANSKGIAPIITLFQANGGGGTEDLVKKSKVELAEYIKKSMQGFKGTWMVEPMNEYYESDKQAFESWASSEISKYGVKMVKTVHTCSKTYIGNHQIQSNDKSECAGSLPEDVLCSIAKQAKEQGGGFDFLTKWNGYGLECVKGL